MSQASSVKAVLYALGANSGILLAKGVAAAVTGSSAMLAEAIHSAADCGNQVLLLFGMKDAVRPPDAKHPLGYGKVVYFWAFLVAVILFTLGGLFSVYEGWHKLHQTEPVSNPGVAIAVLVVAIVLEAFSLAGCIREIRKISGRKTLWQFFRTSRNSELIVVLGEDIAALAGLVFALVAVVLAVLTGNPMWVQIKVTIFNALFAVFLIGGLAIKRNFFKYVFDKTFHYSDVGWNKFTWSFALFFIFTAIANEFVRLTFKASQIYDFLGYQLDGINVWILFKVAFILPITLVYAWLMTRNLQKYRLPAPSQAGGA